MRSIFITALLLLSSCTVHEPPIVIRCDHRDQLKLLADSIHALNSEVFWLRHANFSARAGIFRYALTQSIRGEEPDAVIYKILFMGLTASPYEERDALECDKAFDRAMSR